MTEKVYIVTDLGPGDGGKGGVVHKISDMMGAHTVIKVGGAQGSHGVVASNGLRFAFSQWGCGTFEGARTHLSSRMVVSPEGLLNEALALRCQCAVHDPFSLLTVDETALCTTPYHGIASRLKEMARGNKPRGTIGTGVGEAYRYMQKFPDLTIRVGDLTRHDLRNRMAAVRDQVRLDLAEIVQAGFLPGDLASVEQEVNNLRDDDFLNYVAARFIEASSQVKTVSHDYLGRVILAKEGVAVVESSHGILTDNLYGFRPHTSALRTLPCFTHAMLKDAGYDGQIVNLGITRAYSIRHGAGPLPTDNPAMYKSLLPGSHKETNRYQGTARVGPLDGVLLRYAIDVCGGPSAFDGLAITWFDQMQINKAWQVCKRYRDDDDQVFFLPNGAIRVFRGNESEQVTYQEALAKRLFSAVPDITQYEIGVDLGRDEIFSLCNSRLKDELGVPVRMISFGPTERNKVCK